MNKKITALLIVLLLSIALFASSTDESKGDWNIYAGSSYLVSHIGASYDFGRLEVGGTLYSGFPNIAIIGYAADMSDYKKNPEEKTKPNFVDYLLPAFRLAYMGNIGVMYDLTKSETFDFLIGASLSGAYSNLGAVLGSTEKFNIGIIALDVVSKVQFNFTRHSGIYIATELPLCGVAFTPGEENKTNVNFITPGLEGYLSAAFVLLLYTARVGYVYRF